MGDRLKEAIDPRRQDNAEYGSQHQEYRVPLGAKGGEGIGGHQRRRVSTRTAR
jgi:hypothetical protein